MSSFSLWILYFSLIQSIQRIHSFKFLFFFSSYSSRHVTLKDFSLLWIVWFPKKTPTGNTVLQLWDARGTHPGRAHMAGFWSLDHFQLLSIILQGRQVSKQIGIVNESRCKKQERKAARHSGHLILSQCVGISMFCSHKSSLKCNIFNDKIDNRCRVMDFLQTHFHREEHQQESLHPILIDPVPLSWWTETCRMKVLS